MKKIVSILAILIAIIGITGCSTKSGLLGVKKFGEQKDKYSPMYIDKLEDSKLAYIKSSRHLIIVTVNGKRITPFYKVMVGQGVDSIKIKEGNHSISVWLGVDINIGKVYFKAGHEYFIDYAKKAGSYNRTNIHYWIKDLTENKIVYGKETK